MRGLGLKDGLIAAAIADFISLSAFEVDLFSWIAFVLFPAPHHLMPSSAAYWLLTPTSGEADDSINRRLG
jgi:hypothetical protein